jgi:hypothetical protein
MLGLIKANERKEYDETETFLVKINSPDTGGCCTPDFALSSYGTGDNARQRQSRSKRRILPMRRMTSW